MEATAVFMTSWAMKFDTDMLHLWYNPHISHTSKRQLSWILMDFADLENAQRLGKPWLSSRGSTYIYIYVWWLTYPSGKYDLVSWDDDIPKIWKNKTYSKPPTRIYIYIMFCQ